LRLCYEMNQTQAEEYVNLFHLKLFKGFLVLEIVFKIQLIYLFISDKNM